MNLNIKRESYTERPAWLASHRGAMYKTGGITLSRAAKSPDIVTGKRIYYSGEFVGLLEPRSQKLFGTYGEGVKATLVTALLGANNDIKWTARTAGTAGNNLAIAYVNPSANEQSLSVSVTIAGGTTTITVNLATNSTGDIISTANDVLAAVNLHPEASALVFGELAINNNGYGVVTAMAATALSGGADPVSVAASLKTGDVANNNAITWNAVKPGSAGNNIQVALVDPSANSQPLTVSVLGSGTETDPYIINVSLETDGTGQITSTAADVIVAVNNHGFANTLVRASSTGTSNGTGTVAAAVADSLAGGTDANVSLAPGEFGILLHDVDVTDGDGIGALLVGGKVITARLPKQPDDAVRAALPHVLFTTENAP